jgi:hypothetical protein
MTTDTKRLEALYYQGASELKHSHLNARDGNLARLAFPVGISRPTMEQIMQMQDDIHKLKKLMDLVFDKMCVLQRSRFPPVPVAPPEGDCKRSCRADHSAAC